MLLYQFNKQLEKVFKLLPGKHRLLLAVSGGLDSVVLTDLFNKAGFDYIIAHCNFQLRGAESERDEAFVKSLGEQYGKQVLAKRFETTLYATENKLSIQEAARELRYQWFEKIMKENQATINYLVTAHHANDNIETVLMHLFRGTGLKGITGIPETDKERKIIRPLLFTKREAILAYAQEHALAWVEDSSNASDKYTRNFFRLNILPLVKQAYPNAEDNLLQTIKRLDEAKLLYEQSLALHKRKLLEQKSNEIHIPVLKMKQSEPLHTIVWEIVKPFGFSASQVNEVVKLLDADNGSFIASGSHRIIKNRNHIIIAPQQTETGYHILIETDETKIHFSNGTVLLNKKDISNRQLPADKNIATLDIKHIRFPLLLRKWKQGDYFYPFGMQKKKKLSRFFIDNKLSKTEKENVWVIESDKKILWVVGQRIDDRFKVNTQTKQVLQIEFTPDKA